MVDEATTRVLQLIDFLGAYDAQKNPPVRDVASSHLFLLRSGDLPSGPGITLDPAGSSWLAVDFVSLPPRPEIPRHVERVLDTGADLIAGRRPAVAVPDDPHRREIRAVERAEAWIAERWEPWSVRYLEARAVKNLYRDLFEQRELLVSDRETYELVWGFGPVRRQLPGGTSIDHPVLTIPVEVEADPASGQLRVEPAGALQVEAFFLGGIDIDDRSGFNTARHEVAQEDAAIDPWDPASRRELLQRLVRTIDHDGGFSGEVAVEAGTATVDDSWVLYLRRRRPDYQGFLDDLRVLYRSGAAPPDPLKAVVIDSPSTLVGRGSVPGDAETEPPPPLLLPLPSNEEQRRILELAQHRPGVTVQGPPGTGKSHTIANLISHYVAHGKRVLVVAEKEQALSVLAGKIPAGIRDLTVSVLGADDEGRRRLESSIGQIQARVAGLDCEHADEQIARLELVLAEVDAEIVEVTDRLLAVRTAEITTLDGEWEAGTNPTPARAARWLAANEQELGYIDDPVPPGRPPPFTAGDCADYVQLLQEIGLDRAAAASTYKLPDPAQLPTGAALNDHFEDARELLSRLAEVRPGAVSWDAVDDAPDQLVRDLTEAVRVELDWIEASTSSWTSRLGSELADALLHQQWRDFADDCRHDREHIIGLADVVEAHRVDVPDEPSTELALELREASERLFSKGRLGFGPRANQLKRALGQCLVDGRVPASPDEIDVCLAQLELDARRRVLATRWNKRLRRIDGPLLDQLLPELGAGEHLGLVYFSLRTDQRWKEIRGQLDRLGIATDDDMTTDQLLRVQHVLGVAAYRRERRYVEEDRIELHRRLEGGRSRPDASPLWSELSEAVLSQDVMAWDRARDEVESLSRIVEQSARLQELHLVIRRAAPRWTERLLEAPAPAPGSAGDPAHFERAWQWRQLETWLAQVREAGDPGELQRQLEALSERRRRTVAELVSHRAWRRLADRIGDPERQALNSYLQAVKRYGRTGGKFAARWLAQIRAALNDSKEAVPVWIMPTNRALTSFRPEAVPPFDVLVIDEASQLGQEALPLLSLAKTTIVVGDDRQTSPENVGLQREPVFNLLEEYLTAIPRYRTLFDPDASLYDLAFQKFPDVIMLTEHFRSLPPIIEFSNTYAYDNQIVSLRDRLPVPDWSPVGAVRVPGATRAGDVNHAEVDAVVELIAKLCADPRYDAMTFGVISLLGAAQSKLIWRRLFDELGPDVIRDRSIRCGEPATFQGDERDVIIITLVVAAAPGARVGSMTNRAAERRINVAASRARNQLWVVHSVDPEQFSSGDLRGALIRHCQSPARPRANLDDLEARCASSLERDVFRAIAARGYGQLYVQHPVGRYQIDIVVEGPDNRLAIECETDRWQGEDAWRRDRARQQVLERAGWTFERVRASTFHRRPSSALDPLWTRLDELGIYPGDGATGDRTPSRSKARSKQRSRARPAPGRKPARAKPSSPGWAGRRQPALAPADDLPSVELAPYQRWQPYPLAPVGAATEEQLVDGVFDIVEVEGPVHAERVIRLYVEGSGGRRVSSGVRRALSDAIDTAVAQRLLVRLDDDVLDPGSRTLRLVAQPDVAARELGPRRPVDVPRAEVRLLIDRLGLLDHPDQANRAVREILGFPRLTDRIRSYLDECLHYTWRPDDA